MKTYIIPNLSINRSGKLDEYFTTDGSTQENFHNHNAVNFPDLLKRRRLFVLGEPGYGKSRLLLEIMIKLQEEHVPVVFVDLKKIKGSLLEVLAGKTKNLSHGSPTNLPSNFLSEDFLLENAVVGAILLDALDEVQIEQVPSLLAEIAILLKNYPQFQIYISCRTHHIKRHQAYLQPLDFEAVELRHFHIYQVIQYLNLNCVSFSGKGEKETMELLRSVKLLKYDKPENLLYTPRYLEIFCNLIDTIGFSEVAAYSRNRLLDTIIWERLKLESGKADSNGQGYNQKKRYIIQCLERLALVMEIQRTNIISKDDFTTFLLDTNLNLDNQLLLEVFFDNTILKDKDDHLEFENTEFQEYLAAKALQRIGRIDQTIADIGIDQRLRDILPNWLDVLSYVVELEPVALLPLLQFGKRSNNLAIFSLIRHIDIAFFDKDPDQKDQIFQLIFDYHIRQCRWLEEENARALVQFYIPERNEALFREIIACDPDFNGYVRKTMLVLILEYILAPDLSESVKAYWRPILFDFFSLPEFAYGDVLHRFAAKCLENVASIDDFTPYLQLFNNRPPSIGMAMVEFHRRVDPNHQQSIHLFIAEEKRRSFITISPLNSISSRDGFLNLLQIVKVDLQTGTIENKVFKALDRGIRFDRNDSGFYGKLSMVWDKDIEVAVVELLVEAASYPFGLDHDLFLGELMKTLYRQNPACLSLLLQTASEQDFPPKQYFELAFLINIVFDISEFPSFYLEAKDKLGNTDLSREVIYRSRNDTGGKVFKKYFPTEAKNRANQLGTRLRGNEGHENRYRQWQTDIYEKFIRLLSDRNWHALAAYTEQEDTLKKILGPSEKESLKALTISFFTDISPEECFIIPNSGSLSYHLGILYHAIGIVKNYHLDINPFRQKLIRLFPILSDLNAIIDLLDAPPRQDEIKDALAWYLDLDKPAIKAEFRLYDAIDLIDRYNIQNARPWLKGVLENNRLSFSVRNRVLNLLFSWGIETAYIAELFDGLGEIDIDSESYLLAIELNLFLLKRQFEPAIDWRMQEVLRHVYKIPVVKQNTGFIRPAAFGEGFSKPLFYVVDSRFVTKMLWYLEESFKFLARDSGFLDYVRVEFWEPVTTYFKNLKSNKTQLSDYLSRLRQLVEQYEEIPMAIWFNYQIATIQNEYLHYIGHPELFGASIRKFNQLKDRQYLDVAYPFELFVLVQEVLNGDLRNWAKEGYYKFMAELNRPQGGQLGKETLYQKMLVQQLELFLLRRGLRNSDILSLHREVQMLNNRRPDLILTYGSIGSVMVEVKRADNDDLSNKNLIEYRDDHFFPYMRQNNCDFGIFLIYQDTPGKENFAEQIAAVRQVYERYQDRIEVVGIDIVI